jgi:hypothetical protein
MRKALIGMILAATVLSPVAAEAQRGRGGERVREQNESNDSGEARQGRAERQQQREARETPQVQQAQPAPQVQQQPQTPVVQQRERGDDRGGNRGDRGDRGDRGGRGGTDGDGNRRGRTGAGAGQTSAYPEAWQGNPNDPALRRYQRTEQRNQQRYDNGRRGDRDGNWRGDRGGGRNNNWNRNWRSDRRYDWQNWRHHNRNIFRAGRYYSPYRNYGYNRFDIGIFLEPLFYGRNYWIGDPWQYRLPPAYPGTQWVRYYNDVLLVDVYTGEVLDVIYGFFW